MTDGDDLLAHEIGGLDAPPRAEAAAYADSRPCAVVVSADVLASDRKLALRLIIVARAFSEFWIDSASQSGVGFTVPPPERRDEAK